MKKYKGIVLITGVGLRKATKIFKKDDPANLIDYKQDKYKANAACGTAIELSKAGYVVYMTGGNKEYLQLIQDRLLENVSYFTTDDLKNKDNVSKLVENVEILKNEHKCNVDLVYYGGVSGKDQFNSDSVLYSPFDVPSESISSFFEENIAPWYNLIQGFEKVFESQNKTKMILISAISALRTKTNHSLDAAQKSAIHAMARSFALDLTKKNIFVTEVMPGMTDTGFYDSEFAYETLKSCSKDLGYEYNDDTFPVFKSERVGETIKFILESPFHVREISFMPYGQYPHLGA